MSQEIRLCDLAPGGSGVVSGLDTTGGMRRRFLDIGLTRDTAVACVGRSPLGDPSAYLIRGAVVAIRAEDCRGVRIRAD
ncbi:MAG TPA: FeoA family protein [Oscillospiraceae bacterium]|nr:FeoA family protein [Oscillospiraceae bacterium]HPS75526.1 FeoA family protein [Oscillospiraceae bacterium]